MKIPMWGFIAVVLAVIINNLVWLHSAEDKSIPNDDSSPRLSNSPSGDCAIDSLALSKPHRAHADNFSSESASQSKASNIDNGNHAAIDDFDETLADRSSPIGLEVLEVEVPIEASENFLHEHDLGLVHFYAAGSEEKLDTIQSLSAQGDDLEMINEILKTEDDSTIRMAAIGKLTHERSFGATNILIEALDDPVEDVTLTALRTIATNGDRTLVSLLQKKMGGLSSGTVRDEFQRSIDKLQYSATMGMDETPNK